MTLERRHLAMIVALPAGIAARLWFVFTTYGTNDTTFKAMWGQLADRYGMIDAYAHHPLLNHPPIALWIFRTLVRSGEVADRLRLIQVVADMITVACLLRLSKDRWPAIVFLLSPVAILLSGFHGNTDSTLVCLILVAVVLMQRSPLAGGLMLAVAAGIKIVAILLLPLFLIAAGRRWWQCAGGFGVACIAIFAPLLQSPVALRNIFGYSGQAWWWGWPAMAARLEPSFPLAGRIGVLQLMYGRYLIAFVIVAIAALYFRRNGSLQSAIALTFIATLFVSTGFAVQYFIWPLPFLPFLYKRWETITLHAVISLFLIAMYTSWARGWPWTYANSLQLPWPYFEQLVRAGFVVWILFGIAAVAGAVRRRDHTVAKESRPALPS